MLRSKIFLKAMFIVGVVVIGYTVALLYIVLPEVGSLINTRFHSNGIIW